MAARVSECMALVALIALACSAAPVESDRQAPGQAPQSREIEPAATRAREPVRQAPTGPRVPVLDCTPTQEIGYRRGREFPITVVSIDGRLVETETATAYWAMQLAAADDGVELPIYSGFQSHQHQEYFYKCYRSCSCNSCSPAAKPGHSKHQSGSAIDFGQWPGVIDWLNEHGKQFRFFPTVKREPWHWEYRPRRNKRRRKVFPPLCTQEAPADQLGSPKLGSSET